MKKYKLIILAITVLILTSCKKENDDISKQKIYFEYSYINFAWGLSYSHWIIDDQGNVRINKKRDSIVWIDPLNLNDYVEKFDTVILKIDKKELQYYIDLIPSASKGKILQTEQHMADFGGYDFSCYAPDGKSYKKVILSSLSDILSEQNENPDAKKIDNWLKNLFKKKN